MENQPPIALGQISPDEWNQTLESIKRLVAPLLLGTIPSQHESRLIQLLDATPTGIAVHDAAGQLIYINEFGRSHVWSDDQVQLAQAIADQLEIAIQQANLWIGVL